MPEIQVLGNPRCRGSRSSPSSIRHDGRYLHHNFVVAVLNDLFGIQSRGGCSCAGPYGHRLLGIDIETSHEFEREIARGCEGIKPGWVRVNFNYFISETVFGYIVDAVELVAREGWRLLPWYRFEPATGLWRHAAGSPEPPLSLHDVAFARQRALVPGPSPRLGEAASPTTSPRPIGSWPTRSRRSVSHRRRRDRAAVGEDFEDLRWFWLPDEVRAALPS